MKRLILSLLLISASLLNMHAQRVGVVLSGGGAKGLAHIGMLKALEDHNIPIDYITGTSMGAIIGALYAAGYSPAQMESIFLSKEFETWLSNIDPNYANLLRKPPISSSWLSIFFDFKQGLQPELPTNLVSPNMMDWAFIKIFGPADAYSGGNLDSLFIPFRCVASDVEAHQAYAPSKAYLSQIVRASMTFPLYFKPIRIDGKLLFDGGIYNNFPVDIMKKDFNPDVIIGGDVTNKENRLDDDNVMSHINYLVTETTDYNVDNGIVVQTSANVGSVIDFSRAERIIELGYESTLLLMDSIEAMIPRRIDIEVVEDRRCDFTNDLPALKIDTLLLEGLKPKQETYIRSLFFPKQSRKEDIDQLQTHYLELCSDERMRSIYPWIRYDSTDQGFNLHMSIKTRSRFKGSIGGSISSSPTSQIFIGLGFEDFLNELYSLNINAYAGRFYNSIGMTGRLFFSARRQLMVELDASLNGWNYFRTTTFFSTDPIPSYLIKSQHHWGLKLATDIGKRTYFSVGISQVVRRFDYYQSNHFSAEDTTDRTSYRPFVAELQMTNNSLSHAQYPHSGILLQGRIRFASGWMSTTAGNTNPDQLNIGRNYNFLSIDFNYEQYFKFHKYFSLGIQTDMSLSTKELLSNYSASLLNAEPFNPTPESQNLFLPHYRAYNYVDLGLKGIIHAFNNFDVRLEVYVFQPFNEIKADGFKPALGDFFAMRYFAYSLAAVYHTRFGPISLSFNHYQDYHKPTISVMLNIGMVLFNPQKL